MDEGKQVAISVNHLSKIYKLYDRNRDRLKEALHLGKNINFREHYALNDVSLEVNTGETVGIIGTNGSGKSTILKIITGVTHPTSGTVEVNGRVSALLELQGGSIDVYPYLTDSQATELRGKMEVLAAPSNVVQALFLNNADETLKDVKVRQAICYALDRDSVNDFVFGGNAAVVSCAMLPTMQSYYEDLNSVYGTSGNAEKAKELLMRRHSLSEAEAHRMLQRYAMDHGMKMTEWAERILKTSG